MSQKPCTHCGQSACKNGQPSVHVLETKDGGVVHEHYVCEAVAVQLGLIHAKPGSPTSASANASHLEKLLQHVSSQFDLEGAIGAKPEKPGTRCAGCGLGLAEFRKRGRAGCPRCYQTFKDQIRSLVRRVHEADRHSGRFPGRPSRRPRTEKTSLEALESMELRQQLARAVEAEDYEAAARIRDALRRLGEGAESS